MVERFPAAPEHRYAAPAGGTPRVIVPRQETELDEFWSFGGQKTNRPGVGSALAAAPRPGITFPGGDRRGPSAPALGEQIPAVSQAPAVCYTEYSRVDPGVSSCAHLRAISKLACKTNPSERCTCTRRPRVARLGRATVSFSKKLRTHSGASKYVICDYHLTTCA
jgi:hypothetical protein